MKLKSTFLIAHVILLMSINTNSMAQNSSPLKADNDPRIFLKVREFLKALNSGGGKPIEALTPVEAHRQAPSSKKPWRQIDPHSM